MNQKTKGILCIIASAFFFSLMSVFVRLSGDIPSFQKSFFRNLVAAFAALFLLIRQGGGFRWKKGLLPFLTIRSCFGLAGVLCTFYATDHLLLADASMLGKMSPFFGVIFSRIFLHEKVRPSQAAAIAVAFIGSIFIIKPTPSNMALFPAFIGFLGGLTSGAAYTTVRYLGLRGERGPYIVFFFSAFSCIAILPVMLMNFTPMSALQVFYLLMAGVCAAGGQFTVTAAYCYAPAREISVYDYSSVIFAALLGLIFFGQVPDHWSFIGYALICAMAVAMFLDNRRADKKAA